LGVSVSRVSPATRAHVGPSRIVPFARDPGGCADDDWQAVIILRVQTRWVEATLGVPHPRKRGWRLPRQLAPWGRPVPLDTEGRVKEVETEVSSPPSRLSSTRAFDTRPGGLRPRESRCSHGVLPLQGNYPPDALHVPSKRLTTWPTWVPGGPSVLAARRVIPAPEGARLGEPDARVRPIGRPEERASRASLARRRGMRRAEDVSLLPFRTPLASRPQVRHGAPADCSLPKGSRQLAPTLPLSRR